MLAAVELTISAGSEL